uniref:Peroxin/Ferlin domain-containing protein n=1 Tax=Pyramimonas obovata TaxID=1411642 RepID=A0A7S0RHI6_9CHLO
MSSRQLPPPRTKALIVEEDVYENQRYLPFVGWTRDYMLPTDRKQWSTADGRVSSDTFPALKALPNGWQWEGDWAPDISGSTRVPKRCDKDGWTYAVDFDWFTKIPQPGDGECTGLCYVRRRRWVRRRKTVDNLTPPHDYGLPEAPAAVPPSRAKAKQSASTKTAGNYLVSAVRRLARLGVWLSVEQVGVTVTHNHRLVVQNLHLVLCVFWLFCGFLLGELMASLNEQLLIDALMKQHHALGLQE